MVRSTQPGPARSGYLVIIQTCLQDLMQLARQRVVRLRRACPIAEAVGGSRGRQGDHFPAALGHRAERLVPERRRQLSCGALLHR